MDGEKGKYQVEPSPTLGWPDACGFQPPVRCDVYSVSQKYMPKKSRLLI